LSAVCAKREFAPPESRAVKDYQLALKTKTPGLAGMEENCSSLEGKACGAVAGFVANLGSLSCLIV